MPANYKAELVAVLGQPVAENPTGVMQEAAFAAAGLNWRYLTIEVPPEKLGDAMAGVRAFGMRGVNLTIPHKVAVMQYLDEVSPAARIIGAVNTVRREGDRLIGENTDGKGFLRGLRVDAGVDPKGKRVLLLGAGGAARAIAAELALAGAASIVVVNRTAARGETTTADLRRSTGADIVVEPWRGTWRLSESDDIVVNATSVGLYPNVDAIPDVDLSRAREDTLVADAVFNPPDTALLRKARGRGLRTLDGLSMLVYQGAIGFELWTGQKAPEETMKRALAGTLRTSV
jgi:shikimate dehydrogenase